MMKISFLALIALLLLGACAKDAKVEVHTAGNPLISYSQLTSSSPLAKTQQGDEVLLPTEEIYLKIKPSALGSLFLMSVAQIDTPPAPTGQALANKVVSFERRGFSLFMFESLSGKLATNDIPTKVLLAEFPIVESSKEWISFDLKAGLNLVYQKRSMQAHEARSSEDQVLALTHSFIDKVELRGNYVFINQLGRAHIPAGKNSPEQNISVHLKYVFQSYLPSTDYRPKETLGINSIGFFETDKVITPRTGAESVYIMRQHPEKKIIWHLTGNIPPLFKQAVIDGILYWNQIFGSERIEVETLPSHISVHEPGYNILQWLEWDTAGFAYANSHADPLTGEVLQSHVYMTSVFRKEGLAQAKRYLEQLTKKKPSENSISLSLKGWKRSGTCHLSFDEMLLESAPNLFAQLDALSEEEAQEIFNRLATDYVRSVVAHEVGHALGLRHNFAGSLETTLNFKNEEEKVLSYLLRDEVASDEAVVSTVMDYTPFITSALTGAMIRKQNPNFSYDQAAIGWGHMDHKLPKELPLFCTDGDRASGKFFDCQIWDRFSNALVNGYASYQDQMTSLSFTLAQKMAGLENTTFDPKEYFLKLGLTPVKDAQKFVANTFAPLLQGFSTATSYLALQRHLPGAGDLYDDLLLALEAQYHQEALSTLERSMGEIFFNDFIPSANGQIPLRNKFHQLIHSYVLGLDLAQDKASAAMAEFSRYLYIFEREAILEHAKLLSKATLQTNDQIDWEDRLQFYADGLLSSRSEVVLDEALALKAKKFDYRRGEADLRLEVVKAISQLHFGDYPSQRRTRTRSLLLTLKRHQDEIGQLEINQDRLNDAAYNYFFWEKSRFAPLERLYQ